MQKIKIPEIHPTQMPAHEKWQEFVGLFWGLLKFWNWNVLGMKMVDKKNFNQVGWHLFSPVLIFFSKIQSTPILAQIVQREGGQGWQNLEVWRCSNHNMKLDDNGNQFLLDLEQVTTGLQTRRQGCSKHRARLSFVRTNLHSGVWCWMVTACKRDHAWEFLRHCACTKVDTSRQNVF